VVSSEVGFSKPDPEIFRLACRNLNVDPGESVFVGDLYDLDVVGALNAGMKPAWIRRDFSDEHESKKKAFELGSLSELSSFLAALKELIQ
jgi:putative hydrolase of the HAD superfamily